MERVLQKKVFFVRISLFPLLTLDKFDILSLVSWKITFVQKLE